MLQWFIIRLLVAQTECSHQDERSHIPRWVLDSQETFHPVTLVHNYDYMKCSEVLDKL